MNTIDKRVLEVDFDNKNFEKNAQTSINTLDKFEKKAQMGNVSNGLTNMASSILKFNKSTEQTKNSLNAIANSAEQMALGSKSVVSSVDTISNRFSTLGVIGMSVLNNLTSAALRLGGSILSALPNAIISGGFARASTLEQARFTLQGILNDAEKANEVLAWSKETVSDTAYSSADAAKAAAVLAASGITAEKELKGVMKAIAGTTATINGNYASVADIFSTVKSNGQLMTMQLRQFSAQGLNVSATLAKVFQEVMNGTSKLDDAAQENIRNIKAVAEASNSEKVNMIDWANVSEAAINELVSAGLINFDAFSAAMEVTFGDHAKKANDTFSGSMANIRAALARTGEMFFAPIIAQKSPLVQFLNHIRVAINGVNNALKPFAEEVTGTFNSALSVIDKYLEYFNQYSELTNELVNQSDLTMGGGTTRQLLATVTVFTSVVQAIKQGFLEIFSSLDMSEDKIASLVVKVRDFLRSINITDYTFNKIKDISAGFFGALKIGGTIIGGIVSAFARMLDVLSPIGGMFFDIAGSVGHFFAALAKSPVFNAAFDYIAKNLSEKFTDIEVTLASLRGKLMKVLQAFDAWVDKGDIFRTIAYYMVTAFTNVSNVIETFVRFLGYAAEGIKTLFTNIVDGTKYMIQGIDHSLNGIGIDSIFEALYPKIQKLLDLLKQAKDFLGDTIGKAFSKLGESIKNLDFGQLLTGLMGVLYNFAMFNFARILSNIAGIANAFNRIMKGTSGGPIILKSLNNVIFNLGTTLTKLQLTLSVQFIRQFAEALLMLSAAMFILAMVDPERLMAASLALTSIMLSIIGAMQLVNMMKLPKMLQMYGVAAVLVGLGAAMVLVSIAAARLGQMDNEQLIKGIGGVVVLLLAVAGAMSLMNKFSVNPFDKAASTMLLLSVAVLILTKAVSVLGNMDFEVLTQGIIGVVGLIMSLALAMIVLDGVTLNVGAFIAFVGMAAAIRLLVSAVSSLGNLDFDTFQQGMLGVLSLLAGLAIVSSTIKATDAASLFTAAIMMLAVGAAVKILVSALKDISGIESDRLMESLFVVVSLMAMMGGITRLMTPDKLVEAGVSFALMGVAIRILADALVVLAGISDEGLLKGVVAMIASLVIFAVAAEALGTAMPAAGAILMFSGALLLMATAFTMLAAMPMENLAGALLVMGLAFGGLIAVAMLVDPILPSLIIFSAVLVGIGAAVALFGMGMYAASAAFIAFMSAAELFSDHGADVLVKLFSALLDVLAQTAAKLADTIGQLLVQVSIAIETYAPQIADHLLGALVSVINTVASNLGPLIDALFNLGKAIIEALWEGLKGVREKAGEFLSEFFGGLDVGQMISDMMAVGAQAIAGFFTGIGDFLLNNPVADFIGGILDGTAELPNLFMGKGVETGQSYVAGLDSVDASAAGDRLGEESMNGLKNSAVSVAGEASDEMVNKFVSTMQARAGEATSGGEAIGDSAGTGAESVDFTVPADADLMEYVNYLAGNAGLAEPGGVALAEEGKSGAESVDFSSAGYQSDAGYAQGLLNNAYLAENAAREVARRAKAALENEITIESPSKAYMEDGQLSVMGYALGLLNSAKIAANAAAQVGNTAYSALSNSINNWDINGIDFDTTPTIRPIMDLSNVTAGFNFINSMFGSYQNRELSFIGIPNAMGRTIFDGNGGNVTYQLVIDRAVYNDVPQIESIISNAFDIMGQYRGMNYG